MRGSKHIRDLARSDSGNVAIIFALALPVVVGGAGLGAETTYWYLERLKLQTAADAAVQAAISEKAGAASPSLSAAAIKAAADNGFGNAGGVQVNSPYGSGANASSTVEVVLTSTADRMFSKIFTSTPVTISARAVAQYLPGAPVCVLALNSFASGAASFQGTSGLTLTNCNIMANSTASDAISSNGTADVMAECLVSAGGISVTSHVQTVCAQRQTNAAPVPDPFRALAAPQDPGGSCINVPNGGNNANNAVTIYPGKYCSLSFSKYIRMEPGVYYVEGDVSGNNHPTVTGTGVTIYMAGTTSKVTFNGNEQYNLTAPTSGTYAGVLFFGNRSNASIHKFNGNGDSAFTGDVYFKAGTIEFSGNYNAHNGCTHLIADKIVWKGTADYKADCSAEGMKTIAGGFSVKLLE